MQHSHRLTKMAFLSLLSGCSFLMQKLEFPLPMFPVFLKIDFSDIPALIGGLIYGPLAGVLIEFLKNVLHFIFSGSETGAIPLGQMSNFLSGSIFVVVTVLISKKAGQLKGLIYGLGAATLLMAIVMTITNWYILFPAYSTLIHWTVTGSEKMVLVLYGVAPFNIVKGAIIATVFIPLYLKLKPYLNRHLVYR
ncbi:ECF transporter S component [Paenactinomyces guangxiensis]|uniref:Riboflavin transporter n=1 Tax=Paenactinomyces guangxiensis TaxID=1490290 RepID=A0A7W2A7W5_9BACL|nr:ECF transporter S component [Paenactinomyces guangxiensis]MBA4494030.1 ECF transporter S component [Paenactinomyces guangxiensis]MBH8591225.1 ECF transporter S component [Paenactinomyces guangxiensis]